MTAFATQKNIQTAGASVLPIGSNGAGRSKLMTAAEIRSAAEVYSQAQADAAFVSLAGSYSNPVWLTAIAQSKVTGLSSTLAAKADLVGGVIPTAQIPAIAITEYLGSVASQAAMLALDGDRGDWCLRSDLGTTWVLSDDDSTLLASWTQLLYPTAPVTSVAGRTGAVTLSNSDISGLGTLATQSGTFSGTSSGTNTGDQTISLTGDVTGSGTGSFATSIANLAVTNAMLAGSIAVSKLSITGTPNGTKFLRDDGSWQASSGGSPGGSSGLLQYNNAGVFDGAVALFYSATGTHFLITSQSAAYVPLCVKGAASQSGNLFEARTSGNGLWSRLYPNAGSGVALWISGHDAGGTGRGFTLKADNGTGRINIVTDISAGAQFDDGCTIGGGNNTTGSNYAAAGVMVGRSVAAAWAISHGAYFSDVAARSVSLSAADAYASAATNTVGGSFTLNAGAAGPSNSNGGTVTLQGGKGRGTGTPGVVTIQTTTAGASGTTLQTLRDVLKCDGNTTAGETSLLLFDIDKGSLQRVSIGAADSGGTGFKVLKVPN